MIGTSVEDQETKIYLYDDLKDYIGKELISGYNIFTLEHVISKLDQIEPNFSSFISNKHIGVSIVTDNNVTIDIDESKLTSLTETFKEVHLYTDLSGSGSNSGKGILGAILIGVAIIGTGGLAAGGVGLLANVGGAVFGNALGITGSFLLNMGASLLLNSLIKPPEAPEAAQKANSIVYTGPIISQQEGATMPVIMGKNVEVGGILISQSVDITTRDLPDDD